MAAPYEWKSEFQVNTGTAMIGGQFDPQIVGLSNGNFLVVWKEASSGAIATADGADMVGKIYSATGELVRDAFRLNSSRYSDDEEDSDIAATNDGGFIIVYMDNSGNSSRVVWERHDSSGGLVHGKDIVYENIAIDYFGNPKVAVNLTDNSCYVTFTDDVASNTDIRAVRLSASGVTLASEFDAAQNSSDFDGNGDAAILTNGNLVSVHQEFDGITPNTEWRIVDPTGALVNDNQIHSVAGQYEPEVASLVGGGFVTTWVQGNDINYQVFGNSGSQTSTVMTAALGGDIRNEPDVVGLPDGGFVIVWDNDTDSALEARRFNSNGTSDGSMFTVENADTTSPHVGVTGDGRVLFTWFDSEIHASIWDPRVAPVHGSNYDNTPLNFVDTNVVTATSLGGELRGTMVGDTLIGRGGDDRLIGGKGWDKLYGNDGTDRLYGGNGSDRLYGNAHTDTLNGGGGNDQLHGGRGRDKLYGNDGVDQLYGGGGNDRLYGYRHADTLYGDDGDDRLYGGGARDKLYGNGGNDYLFGGSDNDRLYGNAHADTLNGGAGNDRLYGGFGADTFVLSSGAGVDRIEDYQVGVDQLGVDGNLHSVPLRFASMGSDTLVEVQSTGEDLALVVGVAPDDIVNDLVLL